MKMAVRKLKTLGALLAATTLVGCTAVGNEQSLNAIGGIAGQIVGQQIGGAAGTLVTKLGGNLGTIASALDDTEEGEKLKAAEASAQIVQQVGQSRDIAMQNYLQNMVGKLAATAPGGRRGYTVTLLSDPNFNAMTPGAGKIFVNEGLIAKCDTEAQVAAVLAHEMAHIIEKHPRRGQQTKVAAVVGLTVLEALAPQATTGVAGTGVALGTMAAVNGFSRSQESEADMIGMDILAAAGYDPQEMITVQRIMDGIGRQVGEVDNFFFGNHPTSAKRIAAAEKQYYEKYAGFTGVRNTLAYERLSRKYK